MERTEKTIKRCLLPTVPSKQTPRIIPDVYLCDNCDAEFSSHVDMQKHEKECYGTTVDEINDSEEEIEIIDHIKPPVEAPLNQNGFLNYFQLGPKSSDSELTSSKSKKSSMDSPSKRWVSVDMCLHKNRSVEFSSYSGKKMLEQGARRDLIMKVEKTINYNEQYCYTSNRNSRELKEFYPEAKVTYRKTRRTPWSHQYSFTKKERRDRFLTLKTGKKSSTGMSVEKGKSAIKKKVLA